jgi:hypothetical protein
MDIRIDKVYIYGLKDPRTNEIRYIGKSNNPERRYSQHFAANDDNSHKCNWIKSLKRKGLRPELVILEITTPEEWEEREKHWIEFGVESGWDLTNIRAGGNDGFKSDTLSHPDILERFIPPILIDAFRQLDREKQWDLTVESAKLSIPFVRKAFAGDAQAIDKAFELIEQFVKKELCELKVSI